MKNANSRKQTVSAIDSTLTQRGNNYGLFATHAEVTQKLKWVVRESTKEIHGVEIEERLSPSQLEALDMIFHKIGRIINGNPNIEDHWHDIAGYAELEAKIQRGEGV